MLLLAVKHWAQVYGGYLKVALGRHSETTADGGAIFASVCASVFS